MSNNFNLNKFNSLLETAKNAISCDSECQKKKKADELKKNLLVAKSNLVLAEPNFELAKKNYYTYVSGQSGYNELVEEELTQQADQFIGEFKDNFDTEISNIKTKLETYNGIFINFRNVVDLYEQYKEENIELFKELKDETNDILTNDRKTYYQNQEIDGLNLIYFYILWIIYFVIVCCYGVFSLIYPSQFNWKIRLFILVLFIILPFISTFILGKIIQLLYWLFSMVPKNVYK
jgi:hypothetical protein